ncbi:MAG: FmdB family zinc ribbon protein [Patescibacteria group bacterium]|nr:hypothetical protein [Patescibacteria group bacterium]
MPVFEYKCKKCNSVFETFLKSKKEEKDVSCVNCEAKDIEKVFSSFYSKIKDPDSGCENCPVKGCPKRIN